MERAEPPSDDGGDEDYVEPLQHEEEELQEEYQEECHEERRSEDVESLRRKWREDKKRQRVSNAPTTSIARFAVNRSDSPVA